MGKATIINYSIPFEFLKEVEDLYDLLDNYDEFKTALTRMNPRYNKITKQNQLKTAKFRFIIKFCKREIKKKLLLPITNKDA